MNKQYVRLFLFLALLILPLTAVAQGGDRGVQAPPPEATVVVDCLGGDTIFDALKTPAVVLTIELDGMCIEDVNILRSKVILRGFGNVINAPDGITPPEGDDRVLTLFGINTIDIEDLTLRGGRFGLSINATFGVNVRNTSIEDAAFGVLAGSASGSINLSDTTIFFAPIPDDPNTEEDEAEPNGFRGIWATNGSNVTCVSCNIDNFFQGIYVTQLSAYASIGPSHSL